MRLTAAALALALTMAGSAVAAEIHDAAPIAETHGSYRTYLLLHEVGAESYQVARKADGGRHLNVYYGLNDRGSNRVSGWDLDTAPDGRPLRLEEKRDGAPAGEVWRTTLDGGQVTVEEPTGKRTFAPPSVAFPIFPAPPAALEGAMIRYWRAHGSPARLPVLRASAEASPVEIRRVGEDVVKLPGGPARLTRYTVGGLMFGHQVVWMDHKGRLAALMTFAGGLPIEQVLDDYRPAFEELVKRGVAQEMALLDAMGRQVKPEASGAFAIVGARLIDGTGAPAIPDSAVVVRGGRIAAAGPRGAVPLPAGIKIIHAEGQSLLPGLWEMHSHYSGVEFGPALLAAGVTTARDCGGEFGFLTATRDRIAHGALGPRLLLAGLVDSGGLIGFGQVEAETPALGVAAVNRYADAGFQQIKVYTQIKPDVLKAISEQAHKRGLTVTGHVPAAVDAFGGIADGMDQINHLQFVTRAMQPPGASGPVDLSGERAKQLVSLMKERRIVIDPTVGWGEMGGHPRSIHAVAFEPGLADAPFTLASKFDAMGSDADPARYRERTAANLRVIKALYDAGVPIVAGSDTNLIGYGLDRELEMYVAAGLPPMAAIQTATLGAARAMKLDRESGSIEAGKRADLMLVEGDPLANISDLRRVTKVVRAGQLYDSAALGRLVGFHRTHGPVPPHAL